MASLLVTRSNGSNSGSATVQRRALERLMDPEDGNPLVRKTLTCLERELNGAQATLSEDDATDIDDDDDDMRPSATLDQPNAFVGAVESSLPLDPSACNQHLTANPTLGDKRHRSGRVVTQSLHAERPGTSADNAVHTVLFPRGTGGRADTESACTWTHYRRKMIGSIAHVFGKAEEFIWYHYQLMAKRAMQQSKVQVVTPHLAMNATRSDVDEHAAELHQRWADLRKAAPDYVPYCTARESFTGNVGTNVIGSKAYWKESEAELKRHCGRAPHQHPTQLLARSTHTVTHGYLQTVDLTSRNHEQLCLLSLLFCRAARRRLYPSGRDVFP